MSLSLYKPNSKNTGCGFNFQVGLNTKTSESTLYVKSIKQHSWDENKKQGYFQQNVGKQEKNITIKFNEYEIANLINALEKRLDYSTFHTFNEDKTSIKLTPWNKKAKKSLKNKETGEWEETWVEVEAFSFSLTRNGNQNFSIGLEPGEGIALREYFKFTLQCIFSDRHHKQLAHITAKKSSEASSEAAPF